MFCLFSCVSLSGLVSPSSKSSSLCCLVLGCSLWSRKLVCVCAFVSFSFALLFQILCPFRLFCFLVLVGAVVCSLVSLLCPSPPFFSSFFLSSYYCSRFYLFFPFSFSSLFSFCALVSSSLLHYSLLGIHLFGLATTPFSILFFLPAFVIFLFLCLVSLSSLSLLDCWPLVIHLCALQLLLYFLSSRSRPSSRFMAFYPSFLVLVLLLFGLFLHDLPT